MKEDDPRSALVSVVIPTRNRAALLRRSIDSVLAQDDARFELIVVDDASTDDTAAVIAGFGDPRLRALRQAVQAGAAAARNAGIRAARGAWIAFNDDDDTWLPGKLARQRQALANSGADWCLCGFYRDALSGRRYIGGADLWRQLDFTEGMGSVRDEGGPDWSLIATPGWLIGREALEQAGLFDERIRSFDDWELGLRLDGRCRRVFVDEPLFVQDTALGGGISRLESARLQDLRLILAKHPRRWVRYPATQARHFYLLGRLTMDHGELAEAGRALRAAVRAQPGLDRAWRALLEWALRSARSAAQRLRRGLRRLARASRLRWP